MSSDVHVGDYLIELPQNPEDLEFPLSILDNIYFSINIGDTPENQEIVDCMVIEGDPTLYLSTALVKDHPSGTPINIVWSEADYDNFYKKDSDTLVTSVASKTGSVTLDKSDVGLSNVTNDAQLKKAGDTTAGDFTIGTRMFLPNGSASAPAEAFTTSNQAGQFLPAVNQVGFATAGAERIRINSAGIAVTGSVTPTGVLNNGLGQLTAFAQALTLGTTPGELEVATASLIELYLPQIAWGRTNTAVYMISDPRKILTELRIYPFYGTDFSGTDMNSVNEGYGSEGAWDDGIGGFGPAGGYVSLTTPGCLWRLSIQRNNPGVSGGSGGWKLQKLAAGGYT